MAQVAVLPRAEVPGTTMLPFTAPDQGTAIGSRFASIHSHPQSTTPGEAPALVVNRFGQGAAIWCAAPIEAWTEPVNAYLLQTLLREQLHAHGGPCRIEVDAHPTLEATLFDQPERRR